MPNEQAHEHATRLRQTIVGIRKHLRIIQERCVNADYSNLEYPVEYSKGAAVRTLVSFENEVNLYDGHPDADAGGIDFTHDTTIRASITIAKQCLQHIYCGTSNNIGNEIKTANHHLDIIDEQINRAEAETEPDESAFPWESDPSYNPERFCRW